MKLVIDIPENTYKQIQALARNNYFEHDICGNSMRRIANGTPLPRGHGDLIDRNDLLEYTDSNICAYTPTINRYDIITTPTIIEADKEDT